MEDKSQIQQFHLQRESRKLVASGNLLEFYCDHMKMPNGNYEDWDFVHHKKIGGSCCVPVLPDGRIVLVEQYRPINDLVSLELPAGIRDPGESDPGRTAARELEEETGYRAGKMIHLLHLKAAIAFCDEDTDVFLATGLTHVGSQSLDQAEEINIRIFSLEDLLQKIFRQEIPDAKTVAGILAYQYWKSQNAANGL